MLPRGVWFTGQVPLVHADPIAGQLEASVVQYGPNKLLHFHWKDPSNPRGEAWIAHLPLNPANTPDLVPPGTLSVFTSEGRWMAVVDLFKVRP